MENKKCEDCISRTAVEKITWEEPSYTDALNVLTEVREKVRALPSVTPSYNSIKTELKNPKAKTFDILHFVADNAGLSTFEAIEKAYNMGVSEQEAVLDVDEDCISRAEIIDIINFEDEWLFDANSHNADTKIAFSTIKSKISEMPSVTPKASEQQPSREWKEIYAESEGSNSWIEFKCPHCGYSFGMESGEYDWHYGDEIPWKYCPICGGSAEHKPYKTESEETE